MKFLNSKIGRLAVMSLAIASLCALANVAKADRLADVKKAGILHCGVVPGVPGYAFPNKAGKMVGFDVDLCRAIAAAVLGDADKIKTTKNKNISRHALQTLTLPSPSLSIA